MGKVVIQSNSMLFKRYRKVLLSDIDMRLDSGELMLVTGPSGSGKTTFIELLSGIKKISYGSLIILDHNLMKEDFEFEDIRCSWLESTLYPLLPLEKNLHFFAAMFNIPSRKSKKQIYSLLKRFGLYNKRKKFVTSLSLGDQKKADLCRALLGDFKILILHEPLLHLDSQDANNVLDYLQELKKEDVAIVVATTNLAAYQNIATRVLALSKGKPVLNQKVSKILERRESVVVLKPKNDIDLEKLRKTSIVKDVKKVNDKFHIRLQSEMPLSQLSSMLELYNIEIESLSMKQSSLQASVEEVLLNA